MRWSPFSRDATHAPPPIPDPDPLGYYDVPTAPPAICTTGSNADRMREALAFADKNRQAAKQRASDLRQLELISLQQRFQAGDLSRPSAGQVTATIDARINGDAIWKSFVNDEQWGLRLADAYGTAAQYEELTRVRQALREVLLALAPDPTT